MMNDTWQLVCDEKLSGGRQFFSRRSETVFRYHGNGNGTPALADTAADAAPAFPVEDSSVTGLSAVAQDGRAGFFRGAATGAGCGITLRGDFSGSRMASFGVALGSGRTGAGGSFDSIRSATGGAGAGEGPEAIEVSRSTE